MRELRLSHIFCIALGVRLKHTQIMKKFLPLLSVSLLLASVVSAQGLRYGITGAMNASNFAMELNDLSFNPDMRVGFRAGFRMEMPAPFIYDGFYFDGELLLSSKGAKIDTTVGEQSADSTVRPYYLELPIHIGYRYDFGGGNVGFDMREGLFINL